MSYKKIDAQDVQCLISVLGKDRVYTGSSISEDYSHDELGGIESMPEVMVEVE